MSDFYPDGDSVHEDDSCRTEDDYRRQEEELAASLKTARYADYHIRKELDQGHRDYGWGEWEDKINARETRNS